ncbi:heterokaryon incompatibility protein-domain-containing protein, partial [Paraphoma chrysanthemicola]
MAANTFQYQPLHRDIEEIRILLVQPAWSPDAQIQCEIRHASLFSNPQFEALSYTWGGEQNQQLITLAGQPFPVRENLLAALKRLRRSMTARAVWIDAICIDQNNDEEKGFQLPLMTKLYSQAQQVCVWLGEASTLSSVGIKSFTSGWSEIGLNMSSSKLLRNYAVMDWRDGLKSSEAMQRQADLSREFQLGEVRELLSRPWWTRVWIMQEAIVARKLVFMCGGESAPWDSV